MSDNRNFYVPDEPLDDAIMAYTRGRKVVTRRPARSLNARIMVGPRTGQGTESHLGESTKLAATEMHSQMRRVSA